MRNATSHRFAIVCVSMIWALQWTTALSAADKTTVREFSRAAPFFVDYDVFVNVTPPGPDPRTLYKPADFDFQLRPGSVAADAGVRLPGVNDEFTGRAPDLGAYEVGRPLPHYGPG